MHGMNIILSSLIFLHFGSAYNILVIPFPWQSHYKQMELICSRLYERGHGITIVIPKTETYARAITLDKILYDGGAFPNDTLLSIARRRIVNSEGFHISWVFELLTLQNTFTTKMLEDPRVLGAAKKADFVITDTANVGTLAALDFFDLPFFAISPWGLVSGLFSDLYGIPEFPSYIPTFALYTGLEKVSVSDEMNILERVINTLGHIFPKLYRAPITLYHFFELRRKYMKHSVVTMYSKTSLVLVPQDFAVEYPIALPPNVKMVGPLTVEEGRVLPSTFSNILSASVSGTVLVNYGGTFALPEGWIVKLVKILLSLNENVVWRYNKKLFLQEIPQQKVSVWSDSNNETNERKLYARKDCSGYSSIACSKSTPFQPRIEDKGDHLVVEEKLYIFDWIPQNDLLSQPNLAIFMSHCGANSVYEAVYHQVPHICSPLFGDQWDAAGRLKSRQLGKVVLWDEMNMDIVKQSIQDLKSSLAIKESLALVSRRLKNRKRSSVDEAADIIETYMDYGDSSFLRPRGADMPYIQLYCLDIAFLLASASVVLVLSIKRILKCFPSKQTK